jgi:hypothetical protein
LVMIFFMVLGLELSTLHLLDRHPTACSMPPAHNNSSLNELMNVSSGKCEPNNVCPFIYNLE